MYSFRVIQLVSIDLYIYDKQAGLRRATLKISSMISYQQFWVDQTSGCWDITFLLFEVVFHSSIGGHLHLKHFIVWFGHMSLSLKLGEDRTSGCWDISFLIFEVLFHSSIGGHLHLKQFYSLVWSHKLKSKIWGRSDQW